VLSHDAAFAAAAARARRSGGLGGNAHSRPRIALVLRANEIIGQQNDEMAPSWPTRWAGRSAMAASWRVQRARELHGEIAEDALAPITVEDSDAFKRQIKRVPHGVVLVVAPWNYPYMTAINTVAPR
jgi:acyl-CoA reductase-like NAD-dependent aldehyde dehydrogenase